MSEALFLAEQFMARALELARLGEGRTRPNPAVGAVIVRGGRVVGEGYHQQAGHPHAEIHALRQAGENARGADLYVTLEPCAHQGRTGPCVEAVLDAGIGRVFVGTIDPNPQVGGEGVARLRSSGLEVKVGILEAECRRIIAPFAKHVTTGIPFVILKAATTLDGKTATSTGDSRWISNAASREFVHTLRDRVDAVMVGIGTVRRDNPRLTTRLPGGGRDAVRVVVDARLEIPEDATILAVDSAAPTVIATTDLAPADKIVRLRERGVKVLAVGPATSRVDLPSLMRELGVWGIQSILLEGGAELNGSALAAGIVDRVMVFIAPLIFGGNDGKGIFAGHGIECISEAWRLKDARVRRFGDDILFEGEVEKCSPV